jgi:hypothetical protein
MNALETYERICAELGYDKGLVEHRDDASSPVQSHLFSEAQRQMEGIDALYFSEDVPVIYFKRMTQFDEDKIKALHKSIWNQNRVPLLYVVTPGELRIYDCFQDPARPESQYELDAEDRLVKHFKMATRVLEELERFSRPQIDSGAFWKSQRGEHFHADRRVDYRLLERLQRVREKLHDDGLNYSTIHKLLGRSIFIMYLEDRNILDSEYYSRFLTGAKTYPHLLVEVDASYQLFEQLESKFNGDLFPVGPHERGTVSRPQLETIRDLLIGTEMETGQMTFWRPWDFSIIPIELISAVYEEFLHTEEGEPYVSEIGAYYTPHPLVEFILNEVLPWPSKGNRDWKLRVLDPACGSGIFLVEAFRRLVERWRSSHDTDDIPSEELTNILTEYIYGIDISADAIGVAAFSLYLALSDYLKPSEIRKGFQFPHLVYNLDDPESGGRNLFPMDTIPTGDAESTEPFEKLDYDIIVGNPQWKRDGLPEHISDYCGKWEFAQEMAQAFLWRARDFTSDGKIALMAPSKTLFNIESNDRRFRRELFERNYVETVINLCALEDVFTSAAWSACIFVYSPCMPDHPSSTVLYCTPKPKASDNVLPGIIIDSSEIQFLPREKCATSAIIWKVALWGTQRDFELIERLQKNDTLGEHLVEEQGWYWARGLQKPGSGDKKSEALAKLPHMPTRSVGRYWLDKDKLKIIDEKIYDRTGKEETYYAPHVLLKRTLSRGKLSAVFADFDCAFKESIFGIAASDNRESHLKALTAYFNSSFAAYFLFLTAAQWGIERPQISKTKISDLPGIVFAMSDDTLEDLAAKTEEIQKLTFAGISERDPQVRALQNEAHEIIYSALGLSDAERILVDDVLEYVIGFFSDGDTSKATDPVVLNELINYAETFCHTVNGILQFGQRRASATVYAGEAPLRLVSIHFNTSQNSRTIAVQQTSERLTEALRELEKRTQAEYAENLYFRRNVKLYEAETLHIVKPDEKRFWTRSMALRDADEVLAEGIRES